MSRPRILHPQTRRAVDIVLEMTALTEAQLFAKSRAEELVMARAYVYLILRHFNKWTFQAIAREFNRDHGTVLHSLRKLNDLYEHDRYYRVQITQVLQKAISGMGKVKVKSV